MRTGIVQTLAAEESAPESRQGVGRGGVVRLGGWSPLQLRLVDARGGGRGETTVIQTRGAAPPKGVQLVCRGVPDEIGCSSAKNDEPGVDKTRISVMEPMETAGGGRFRGLSEARSR